MSVPALLPGYKYHIYLSFDEKGGNTRSAGVTDYHYSPDQEEHTHKAPYEQRIVDALQEKGYRVSSSGSGSGSNSSSSSMNSFRGVKDSKMFLFGVTEGYMKSVQTKKPKWWSCRGDTSSADSRRVSCEFQAAVKHVGHENMIPLILEKSLSGMHGDGGSTNNDGSPIEGWNDVYRFQFDRTLYDVMDRIHKVHAPRE